MKKGEDRADEAEGGEAGAPGITGGCGGGERSGEGKGGDESRRKAVEFQAEAVKKERGRVGDFCEGVRGESAEQSARVARTQEQPSCRKRGARLPVHRIKTADPKGGAKA